MLKAELPPDQPWFEGIEVAVDLGYLGITTDYQGEAITIPHKKPRKSKSNPTPQLTDTQKAENTAVLKIRIVVENAICGVKRYNILNHRYRNRVANFDDDVIGICAGLWNFLLAPTH